MVSLVIRVAIVLNAEAFLAVLFVPYVIEVAIIDLIAERDHGTPRPRMQSVCSVGKRVISCVQKCVGSLG